MTTDKEEYEVMCNKTKVGKYSIRFEMLVRIRRDCYSTEKENMRNVVFHMIYRDTVCDGHVIYYRTLIHLL